MTIATTANGSRCVAQSVFATPIGPLLLVRTADGLAGAWFEGQRHHPPPFAAPHARSDPLLVRVAEQLHAYFDGGAAPFDVPLDLQGTPFQRAVWQTLLTLGRGETCSYGDLARRVGKPLAVRAVGAAVGRNPVSVIVPCHRVVGGDGSMTGYAGGIERKVALLRLEAHPVGARPSAPLSRPRTALRVEGVH